MVSIKRADDVYPVKGVEVIEVNDVVLNVLDPLHDVADEAGVGRNLDPEGVFDCSHGAEGVNRGSDASYTLGEDPGIARVPTP